MILKAQLRWTEHVKRMDSSHLPRQLLYGELVRGSRPLGRPKKLFKDSIKDRLKQRSIPTDELEAQALDRAEWRSLTTSGACTSFEFNQRERIMGARDQRRIAGPPSPTAALQYSQCPRVYASRIVLVSHTKAH